MRKVCFCYMAVSAIALGLLMLDAARVLSNETNAARFATPESTLKIYIEALRNGDRAAVAECFDPSATDFYLPGPLPIGTYRIQKRIVFGPREVRNWNAIPAAREGDIELQVVAIMNGTSETFSYWFRKVSTGWKIYTHAGWAATRGDVPTNLLQRTPYAPLIRTVIRPMEYWR